MSLMVIHHNCGGSGIRPDQFYLAKFYYAYFILSSWDYCGEITKDNSLVETAR